MTCTKKTLDVIIPSYRFEKNAGYLVRIANLSYPADWQVKFYIIGDNPSGIVPSSLQQLIESKKIFFYHNKINSGLSYSRNRGIDAGSGAWLLFMDDDVIVDDDILFSFITAIEKHPQSAGFGGVVNFPAPVNAFTRSLEAAGYTHYFSLAAKRPVLPWAVGANMVYNREAIGTTRFDTEFGNSGGEEVDFAIVIKKQTQKEVLSVPQAIIHHPWWSDGKPDYSRAFRYSRGNYYLLKKHPEFALWRFCNSSELIFLVIILFPLTVLMGINRVHWLLLIPGVLLIDIVIHTIKMMGEKETKSIRLLGHTWLLKLAEQWGYLSVCLENFYGPGFFKRFDIELNPGRKKHFHTNRWIIVKMGLIIACLFLVCWR